MNPIHNRIAQLINVSKVFSTGEQKTYAVNDVSLDLFTGEIRGPITGRKAADS